ncbi:MAG TPA: hypothetical protein VHN80_21405 [Kineosporiaceae bacterium]|nr:hypothetical protein [Kineosporiaceae bacterium]
MSSRPSARLLAAGTPMTPWLRVPDGTTERRFIVEQDVNLLQVALDLGSPSGHSRSLSNGGVAVARSGG